MFSFHHHTWRIWWTSHLNTPISAKYIWFCGPANVWTVWVQCNKWFKLQNIRRQVPVNFSSPWKQYLQQWATSIEIRFLSIFPIMKCMSKRGHISNVRILLTTYKFTENVNMRRLNWLTSNAVLLGFWLEPNERVHKIRKTRHTYAQIWRVHKIRKTRHT